MAAAESRLAPLAELASPRPLGRRRRLVQAALALARRKLGRPRRQLGRHGMKPAVLAEAHRAGGSH